MSRSFQKVLSLIRRSLASFHWHSEKTALRLLSPIHRPISLTRPPPLLLFYRLALRGDLSFLSVLSAPNLYFLILVVEGCADPHWCRVTVPFLSKACFQFPASGPSLLVQSNPSNDLPAVSVAVMTLLANARSQLECFLGSRIRALPMQGRVVVLFLLAARHESGSGAVPLLQDQHNVLAFEPHWCRERGSCTCCSL